VAADQPVASPSAEAQPHHEEVRVAIALNGGVSLAVWMGGCAVELDRARRAGGEQETARAYDALSECFGRRIVVDILTGSSAGGINATLLAAAMVRGRQLHPAFIRERWVKLGDLGDILHSATEESPTALMDGQKFYDGLLETFKAVLGTDPQAAGYAASELPSSVDARAILPSLDVTMTDVRGVERRFRDSWGGEFVAREHRPRFQFRKPEHFTEKALASAARTSASFPIAFEPWRVEGDAKVLAGLPGPTYGIDGGLLDNAPIRAALELIPTRSATSVVRRYFCYVNADPKVSLETSIGDLPTLGQVGAYTFSLPRSAPLVDHLYAVRDAVKRSQRSERVQAELLSTDLPKLESVAEALLGSYKRRRTLESLEELLPDPSDASGMFDLLEETGGELPWIPRQWQPGREPQWEWGLRPAQRILHLLLDLLRPAAKTADPGRRRALLQTRIEIDKQLEQLDDARHDVTAPEVDAPSRLEEEGVSQRVNAAAAATTERAPRALAAVIAAADSMRTCMEKNQDLFPPDTTRNLFGPCLTSSHRRRHFLRRVLAVEVVRRAFSSEADIETSEPLSFVQLTPDAPSPIFTSRPLQLPGPTSAAQKLTGIGLGHFAGFFRRSWRVNDYLWGRLDAAARLVDLLLDTPAESIAGTGGTPEERARKLAEALLAGDEDHLWHLQEVRDAQSKDKDDPRKMPDWLTETIADELQAVESGAAVSLPVTRALFQRAAQIEVLREELPELRSESKKDYALGSGAKPLKLEDEKKKGGLENEVKAVRKLYSSGSSLPKELTAPAEEVSNLGLQTISQAAFVSLAAIRTAKVPLSKYLGFARPPLLAIAGAVARNPFYRASLAIGFWAATLFLTSCLVTAEDITPTFASLGTPATLVGLAALLGIAGLVAVPGVRARRQVHTPRNAIYAFLLALSGGGLAAVLALTAGDMNVEQLFTAPGAELPETWVLWTVLGALGIASFARLPAPGWLPIGETLDSFRRSPTLMCLLLVIAFVLLGGSCIETVWNARNDEGWEQVAALTALVAAPICAFFALSLGRAVRQLADYALRGWEKLQKA
jgi:predicted acylesterase/phospholipase RssA